MRQDLLKVLTMGMRLAAWMGRFRLAVCCFGLGACSNATDGFVASAVVKLSAADVYADLAALTPTTKHILFEKIGAMRLAAYYQTLVTLATDQAVVVESRTFVLTKTRLLEQRSYYESLDQAFPTVAELWRYFGVNPEQLTSIDLQRALGAPVASQLALTTPYTYTFTPLWSPDCDAFRRNWGLDAMMVAAALAHKANSNLPFVPVRGVGPGADGITRRIDVVGEENALDSLWAQGKLTDSEGHLISCYQRLVLQPPPKPTKAPDQWVRVEQPDTTYDYAIKVHGLTDMSRLGP